MTYIPDCRTHATYNQKYLKKDDSDFIHGFDWCVEMAVDNFFDNDMDGLQDEQDYLGKILCQELPETLKDTYTMNFCYPAQDPQKPETREVKTYADLIRIKLLNWIETERDMMITSMIDEYSEKEYEEIKEEADGQSEKTV